MKAIDSAWVAHGIVKVVNKVNGPLEQLSRLFIDFSVESILNAARHETGLSEWGDDSFMDGLVQLVQSFQTEANFNLIGKINQHQDLTRRLSNRLSVQQLFKEHPEIGDRPLRRPLFILGFPRTGTTLLHHLLTQDTAIRTPLLWELLRPAPIAPQQPTKVDPRIKAAQRLVLGQRLFLPGLQAIHPLDAQIPDECVFLFQNTMFYRARGNIPGYVKWLAQHDMVADYRHYRQQLQVLDWQRSSERWVLKSPFHLWSLDALLTVFPDACIVQLHRDPKKVIPSWCSLNETVQQAVSLQVDNKRIGQNWVDLWSGGMSYALDVRAAANPSQFYDIHYGDLVADPIGTIDQLYHYFDLAWNPTVEHNMRAWLLTDREKPHRTHDYSLGKFGLTAAAVDESFRFYTERFNIRDETA